MSSQKDFIGKWRIVEMELWDRDALDLVAPATLTIDKDRQGQIAFIAVDAQIDYRIVVHDGLPGIEFSFRGFDEGDEVSGRAWAVLEGERLLGRLFFHMGDDSSFSPNELTREGHRRERIVKRTAQSFATQSAVSVDLCLRITTSTTTLASFDEARFKRGFSDSKCSLNAALILARKSYSIVRGLACFW